MCSKPVDSVATYYNYRKGCLIIQVSCHGDTEEVELDDYDAVSIERMSQIEIRPAFATKKLSGGTNEVHSA